MNWCNGSIPLGYDEAWIGEHHSAGWETISSPEIFIGVAADRTKHIRLGTGVISIPYHHPFMVANRMVQLDHMTHGRVMLGVGPGALPGDAYMMGIDAAVQRRRMDEGFRDGAAPDDRNRTHHLQERLVRAPRGDAAASSLYQAPHAHSGGVRSSPPPGWPWPESTGRRY